MFQYITVSMFIKLLLINQIKIVDTVTKLNRSVTNTLCPAKLSKVVGDILEADTNQQHTKQRG